MAIFSPVFFLISLFLELMTAHKFNVSSVPNTKQWGRLLQEVQCCLWVIKYFLSVFLSRGQPDPVSVEANDMLEPGN